MLLTIMCINSLAIQAILWENKVVMVIHRFWQINPSGVPDIDRIMQSALCDKVPSVMSAALNYYIEVCRKDSK